MASAAVLHDDPEFYLGYYQARREPVDPPINTAAARNVRVVEPIAAHEAPEPPRQGDTPSRPAQKQFVTFQAIAPILSVMQDFFHYPKLMPTKMQRQELHGIQQSWDERSNISRIPAVTYGSLFLLDPEQHYTLT